MHRLLKVQDWHLLSLRVTHLNMEKAWFLKIRVRTAHLCITAVQLAHILAAEVRSLKELAVQMDAISRSMQYVAELMHAVQVIPAVH
jgi:hypothetical protein